MKAFLLALLLFVTFAHTALAAVIVRQPSGEFVTTTTLATASTVAYAAGMVIEVYSPQTITTTVTIPADRKIRFSGSGKLIYSGAGNVIFTTGCIDELTPQIFGAVPDYNPVTGAGTNNDTAIQNMLTAARQMPGIRIVSPPGRYLISGYNARGTAVELGDPTHTATNVHISAYGSEWYMGRSSRLLGLFNCTNVIIEGLKIWGYTGGTLGAGRANDHGIVIGYNSKGITLRDVTITNCLGDCVYVGGSMTDGTVTGLTAENIAFENCTFKQRIGNGVASESGGTKSRWCVSLVDAKGVSFRGHNVFYGGVDIEPNVAAQYIANIDVSGIEFRKGPVTPQAVIGTNYWHDEPFNAAGTAITGFITMTGPDVGAAYCYNNLAANNRFEYGYVQSYNTSLNVEGNVFQVGSVYVAGNPNQIVRRNVFYSKMDAAGDIVFYGTVSHDVFTENINMNASDSLFGLLGGGGSFDGGHNIFMNNVQNATGAADMFAFTPAATDTIVGPVNGKPHYLFSSGMASSVVPLTLGTAAQVIDWRAYPSNVYYLDKSGSGSLGGISNVPDGMEITLMFANILTVVDYSQTGGTNLRCRGSINYVPSNTNSNIKFVSRSGVLFRSGGTE